MVVLYVKIKLTYFLCRLVANIAQEMKSVEIAKDAKNMKAW